MPQRRTLGLGRWGTNLRSATASLIVRLWGFHKRSNGATAFSDLRRLLRSRLYARRSIPLDVARDARRPFGVAYDSCDGGKAQELKVSDLVSCFILTVTAIHFMKSTVDVFL